MLCISPFIKELQKCLTSVEQGHSSSGSIYSLQGCLAHLVSGVFCFWMASTLKVDGKFKKLPMMFTKMKEMSYGKTTQKEQSPHRLGPSREEYRENAQLNLGQL